MTDHRDATQYLRDRRRVVCQTKGCDHDAVKVVNGVPTCGTCYVAHRV